MANKVAVLVFDDESEIKAAKKISIILSDFPQQGGYSIDTKPFNPSDLYWGIFDYVEDETPRISSRNWHSGILVDSFINRK